MKHNRHQLVVFGLLAVTALIVSCAAPTAAPTITRAPPNAVTPATTDDLKLTIVYDNIPYDPQLKTDWGFAAVVEYGGHTLLLDTGAVGSILLDNMRQLGVDLHSIEAIILTHEHSDHTGGLQALLDTGIRPAVYAPAKFTKAFKKQVAAKTTLVEVDDVTEVVPGVHTTKPIGAIVEQALVVNTRAGAVMITGCAHPGIARMVRETQGVAGPKIALLAGGFHLLEMQEGMVQPIVAELHQLGVEGVLPSHCTGEIAIASFRAAYGDDAIEGGVGRIVDTASELSGSAPHG